MQMAPGGAGQRPAGTVKISSQAAADGIAVADDGIGMTPEQREHAFEPFFTTRKIGSGPSGCAPPATSCSPTAAASRSTASPAGAPPFTFTSRRAMTDYSALFTGKTARRKRRQAPDAAEIPPAAGR
jgi:hypothetical protein